MSVLKAFFKLIAAGIVSIAILSGMLLFYFILPVHEANPKGNTDYVWPANSMWVKATEGISFGRMDENGFNNKYVVDDPDILILGSSHMEATNVMQDENAAYLLSEKLDGKYSVYNMGISDHNFFKVCQYIPANLSLYDRTTKLLIIETSTVKVSQKNVDQVISASVEYKPSYSTGIMGMLQRIPAVRFIHRQMEGGLLRLFLDDSAQTENLEMDSKLLQEQIQDQVQNQVPKEIKGEIRIDTAAYAELFAYLKDMEEEYGTQILIFYHPSEKLMPDGSISFNNSPYLEAFREQAKEAGISFLDMTDAFEKMYYQDHHVAHGFSNGELGTGHLNRYGHAAVADELYQAILGLEEKGELCQ